MNVTTQLFVAVLAWIRQRQGFLYAFLWAAVVVLGLVLWGPMWVISGLGLEAFLKVYRIYTGPVFLVCLVIALALPLGTGYKAYRVWRYIARTKKEVREYIPYMTKKDRDIIGYLLHHKQKMFQTGSDGGYATPLISKGIVRRAAKGGQVVDLLSVPFEIPDHVWAVLEEHRKDFPYLPPRDKHPPWAQ